MVGQLNEIPVLNVKPLGVYADGRTPYYEFGCSYPNVMTLPTAYPTKVEAFADACTWCKEYEHTDELGNMAAALGVTEKDGKFHGVVNYYHSNT